jgi:hypothetical protein
VETHIYGNLIFDQNLLTLNKLNLIIWPGGTITGASAQGFVDASSEGFLIQEVTNQDVLFPVGTASEYLPALIKNSGAIDNFGLQVFPDVLDEGLAGSSIPELEDCVISTWNIVEEIPGGSSLDLTFQWPGNAEGTNFNRNLSAVGHHSGGSWISGNPSAAVGSGPWEQTLSGVSSTGAFAVGDTESPMAITIIYDEQRIVLSEGWSGISAYLNPLDPGFDVIFQEVIGEVEIVQDLLGFYWPSQGINTIGNWDTYSGYQVKMNGSAILNFSGIPVVDATVSLEEGWNLIPVLVNCASEPAELFDELPVVLVREVAGTHVYWPEFNINTLEFLNPGSAYMAFMEDAGELVFPLCNKASVPYEPTAYNYERIWNPVTNETVTRTNVQHVFAITEDAIVESGIKSGDFLMAFSGDGNCYGSLVYDGGNDALTVFGDAPGTIGKDGFMAGEKIYFRHWDPITGEATPLEPVYENRLAGYKGQFLDNGISVITAFKSQESNASNIFIYPNPADDFFRIQGIFQNADISITDMQGSQQMFYRLHVHNEKFDISGLKSGVYLVEIRIAGGYKLFRERLIVK